MKKILINICKDFFLVKFIRATILFSHSLKRDLPSISALYIIFSTKFRFDERVRDLLDFSIYLDISNEVKFAWKIQVCNASLYNYYRSENRKLDGKFWILYFIMLRREIWQSVGTVLRALKLALNQENPTSMHLSVCFSGKYKQIYFSLPVLEFLIQWTLLAGKHFSVFSWKKLLKVAREEFTLEIT